MFAAPGWTEPAAVAGGSEMAEWPAPSATMPHRVSMNAAAKHAAAHRLQAPVPLLPMPP